MTDKQRTNLDKYYKKTRVCSNCKKEYGIDTMEDDNRVCPICSISSNGYPSRWKKRIFEGEGSND